MSALDVPSTVDNRWHDLTLVVNGRVSIFLFDGRWKEGGKVATVGKLFLRARLRPNNLPVGVKFKDVGFRRLTTEEADELMRKFRRLPKG